MSRLCASPALSVDRELDVLALRLGDPNLVGHIGPERDRALPRAVGELGAVDVHPRAGGEHVELERARARPGGFRRRGSTPRHRRRAVSCCRTPDPSAARTSIRCAPATTSSEGERRSRIEVPASAYRRRSTSAAVAGCTITTTVPLGGPWPTARASRARRAPRRRRRRRRYDVLPQVERRRRAHRAAATHRARRRIAHARIAELRAEDAEPYGGDVSDG